MTPATMNENDLLRALRAAIGDGRIRVRLDCKRLLHTDSPIAMQADHNRWIYGVVAFAAWAWALSSDPMRGLVALVLGIIFYFGYGREWVYRRMRARFHDATLCDTGAFKKLWHLRGVTLCDAGGNACASPDQDWRRFVLDRVLAEGAEP